MKKIVFFGIGIIFLTICTVIVLFLPRTSKTIYLTENGFNPSVLRVTKGTQVVWKNISDATGTVDSDPHPVHTSYPSLNLGRVGSGDEVDYLFEEAGTFTYHNHYEPEHVGTVIVE